MVRNRARMALKEALAPLLGTWFPKKRLPIPYLNDFLREGAGHIGYGIGKDYRGKGYASEGLRLTIEKAWEIIKEDEIYMSVHKDNPASLQVQKKNGAYIHHEDDKEFYTRIKRK